MKAFLLLFLVLYCWSAGASSSGLLPTTEVLIRGKLSDFSYTQEVFLENLKNHKVSSRDLAALRTFLDESEALLGVTLETRAKNIFAIFEIAVNSGRVPHDIMVKSEKLTRKLLSRWPYVSSAEKYKVLLAKARYIDCERIFGEIR